MTLFFLTGINPFLKPLSLAPLLLGVLISGRCQEWVPMAPHGNARRAGQGRQGLISSKCRERVPMAPFGNARRTGQGRQCLFFGRCREWVPMPPVAWECAGQGRQSWSSGRCWEWAPIAPYDNTTQARQDRRREHDRALLGRANRAGRTDSARIEQRVVKGSCPNGRVLFSSSKLS